MSLPKGFRAIRRLKEMGPVRLVQSELGRVGAMINSVQCGDQRSGGWVQQEIVVEDNGGRCGIQKDSGLPHAATAFVVSPIPT